MHWPGRGENSLFVAHDIIRKPVLIADQIEDKLFRDHANRSNKEAALKRQ
jgi:hypothetical protein